MFYLAYCLRVYTLWILIPAQKKIMSYSIISENRENNYLAYVNGSIIFLENTR